MAQENLTIDNFADGISTTPITQ